MLRICKKKNEVSNFWVVQEGCHSRPFSQGHLFAFTTVCGRQCVKDSCKGGVPGKTTLRGITAQVWSWVAWIWYPALHLLMLWLRTSHPTSPGPELLIPQTERPLGTGRSEGKGKTWITSYWGPPGCLVPLSHLVLTVDWILWTRAQGRTHCRWQGQNPKLGLSDLKLSSFHDTVKCFSNSVSETSKNKDWLLGWFCSELT